MYLGVYSDGRPWIGVMAQGLRGTGAQGMRWWVESESAGMPLERRREKKGRLSVLNESLDRSADALE